MVVEDKPAVPRQATPVEPTPQAAPEPAPPAVQAEPAGDVDAVASALLSPEHLAIDAPKQSGAAVDVAPQMTSPNTRGLITQVLAEVGEPMTNAQIHAAVTERGSSVSPQRCHQILTSMARKGDVTKDGDYYTLGCSDDAGVAQ